MRALVSSCLVAFSIALTGCARDPETTAPSRRAIGAASRLTDVKAASTECGATLVTDLTLESDLTCSGDAIIVGADDIRINLNGHTIAGSGAGVGITVRARQHVSIVGGTVRGFVTGVFVAQSTDIEIKENQFTETREGVFFAGTSGSVVKNNVAWQNQSRGIMLRPTGSGLVSTDNEVVDNVLIDNPSGILVFGQPGNTLKGNAISGSSVAAIDLTGGGASGNVVKGNQLAQSAAGIKFGAGWSQNEFVGNTIASNTCGIQGPAASNTFKGNLFSGNGADQCP
jgi:parallel beta-helix repeat protein